MTKKTHKEATSNFDYNSRLPIYIKESELTDDEKFLLTESETFCMLPWIHMHGYPDGRAYPCCTSSYDHPIGNFNEQSMEEVWNGDKLKKIRTAMLNGEKLKECYHCYETEKVNVSSMRNSFNRHFGQHIKEVLPATQDDGQLDVFKQRYFDIRFSNLCNMKCRTCGDTFSNLWSEENYQRWGKEQGMDRPKVVKCGKDETDMIDQMLEHIDHVEQIYFAGGEPLIMPEHYKLMNELVERKKFDVRIAYNTNFSKLEYSDHDLLEMWKLFDSVSVGASIDIDGERGEYLRKGTKWDTIVKNRKRMLEVCPDVNFYLSPTVSVFNVLTLTEFHRSWVDEGLIGPGDFHINLLHNPRDRLVNILPANLKDEAKQKIEEHIKWIESTGDQLAMNRCIPEYKGLMGLIDAEDNTDLIPEFFRINEKVDKYRDEKFDEVFPELTELRKYQ